MDVEFPAPNRKLTTIDALGLVGLAGLLVARFIPVAKLIPFWGCTFRKVTGYPCPGCGLTRAADRFAHGDFLGALKANPLGTLTASLFLMAALAMLAHFAFALPLPEVTFNQKETKRAAWVLGVALTLNYLYVVYAHRVLHFH
jgi:hypothetical protein